MHCMMVNQALKYWNVSSVCPAGSMLLEGLVKNLLIFYGIPDQKHLRRRANNLILSSFRRVSR